MAELADALDSGSSGVTAVEVRVLLAAPYLQSQEALLSKASFLFVRLEWLIDAGQKLALLTDC